MKTPGRIHAAMSGNTRRSRRCAAAMWLTVGLWAAAVLLDTGILAAQLSATVPADDHDRNTRPQDAALAPEFVLGSAASEELHLKAPPGQGIGTPALWPEMRDGEAGAPVEAALEPVPVVHRVKPGETLIGIARGYLGPGADWDALAEANSIEPPYTLQVDREIRIAGAGALRTRAKVALVPPPEPVKKEAELALRAAFAADVNPPPARAFGPLEEGLLLRHPVWEAFPWTVPLGAAAVFLAAAITAGAYAVETAPKRMRPRRAAQLVVWGAAPSGGMFFVAGGLGVLAAGRMAGALAAEILFGVTTAALTGLVAYFGASFASRAATGVDEMPAPELAVRFAACMAVLLAGAFVLSAVAGWTTPALRSLVLPR